MRRFRHFDRPFDSLRSPTGTPVVGGDPPPVVEPVETRVVTSGLISTGSITGKTGRRK
jgi:hypothetical protein